MEWFNSRPFCIQEIIKKYPPNKEYRIGDSPFPVTIYCYSEEQDGNVSLKVDVHSPILPRRVFGIEPEALRGT